MALYKVKVTGEIEAEADSEEHAISAAITIPKGTRTLKDALFTWNVRFTAELIDANSRSI
jgi:hypothetical protein